MSDRKYRQHGYQDDDRDRRRPSGPPRPRPPAEAHDPRMPRDPRVPNMPGFRQVVRCARCGRVESGAVDRTSQCAGCGVALHACIQCTSFDPGAVFECQQKIPARITPKDTANTCPLFDPRVQVERETGSTPAASPNVRKAFDDLFKF